MLLLTPPTLDIIKLICKRWPDQAQCVLAGPPTKMYNAGGILLGVEMGELLVAFMIFAWKSIEYVLFAHLIAARFCNLYQSSGLKLMISQK